VQAFCEERVISVTYILNIIQVIEDRYRRGVAGGGVATMTRVDKHY
jgi:hypothetical protein